jgi:hypothetical protein
MRHEYSHAVRDTAVRNGHLINDSGGPRKKTVLVIDTIKLNSNLRAVLAQPATDILETLYVPILFILLKSFLNRTAVSLDLIFCHISLHLPASILFQSRPGLVRV